MKTKVLKLQWEQTFVNYIKWNGFGNKKLGFHSGIYAILAFWTWRDRRAIPNANIVTQAVQTVASIRVVTDLSSVCKRLSPVPPVGNWMAISDDEVRLISVFYLSNVSIASLRLVPNSTASFQLLVISHLAQAGTPLARYSHWPMDISVHYEADHRTPWFVSPLLTLQWR